MTAYAETAGAEAAVAVEEVTGATSVASMIGTFLPLILGGLIFLVIFFGCRREPAVPVVRAMGEKSKGAAIVFSIFLGNWGAHRFYLGYRKQGIIQCCGSAAALVGLIMLVAAETAGAVLCSAVFLIYGLLVMIWVIVDFFKIIAGKLLPINGMPFGASVPQAIPVNAGNSNVETIRELAQLYQQGIITEEEFQQKKTELLNQI